MAVLSSFLILLATVSGMVLAFEPVIQDFKYKASISDVSISTVLKAIRQYDEVIEIKVNSHGQTIVSLADESYNGDYYIHPSTGQVISKVEERAWIYVFATKLHRSLFLNTTGRVIVAACSFFLLFISISGLFLIVKKQNGWKYFFRRTPKSNLRAADLHTTLGKFQIIPLIIITSTGIILSLVRFDVIGSNEEATISFDEIKLPSTPIYEFDIFENTAIQDIEHLEFPFSEDSEDSFLLTVNGEKNSIHQYTGQILQIAPAKSTFMLLSWVSLIHTARGTRWWGVFLIFFCLGILYFMYSGFIISYRRLSTKITNKVLPDNAKIIILYGSENGQTKLMSSIFLRYLQKLKLSVFMLPMNDYRPFESATELIIFTSTYGNGEAPSNADKFMEVLDRTIIANELSYSVVGFGSLAYEYYCQFAKDVSSSLNEHVQYQRKMPLALINNSSFNEFKTWARQWGNNYGYQIDLQAPKASIPRLKRFRVIDVTTIETEFEKTCLVRIESLSKLRFFSGDLLALYPESDGQKRQYSIGKFENDILLSVKIHDMGICSQYLAKLQQGDILKARIERNRSFHCPKNSDIIMIANGTGIAPFLGMINMNTTNTKILFWGGRNYDGFKLYEAYIEQAIEKKTLDEFHAVYSRKGDRKYVQEIVHDYLVVIIERLVQGAVIMLCGSVSMQNEVFQILNTALAEQEHKTLEFFRANGQILTDCY